MKEIISLIVCLWLSVMAMAENLTHSTYVIGGKVQQISWVNRIDFSHFDNIYLMAAPNWKEFDFNKSQNEIMENLVEKFSYPCDQGQEVIPYFIRRAQNSGTKVLISFAGEGFMERVKNSGTRDKFTSFMVGFMKKYGFDGIEIDWESDLDLSLHCVLMKELRKKLDKTEQDLGKRLYLTTALHSWQVYDKELADSLSTNIDWINVMTYDMGGGIWGYVATHNTPLDKMQRELKNWQVFDKKKICIGLANYGFKYEGISPGQKMPEKLNKYGCYFSYDDFLPLLDKGWYAKYDEKAKVNYYFAPDGRSFVTMENPETIQTKLNWITDEKYAGVFWWEFSYDIVIPENPNLPIRHHLIDLVNK